MSYVEKALLPDERVLYMATLHWIIYLEGLVITIAGGLLGFYSYDILALVFGSPISDKFGRPLAAVAMVIVLVGIWFLLAAYIRQTSTELALTNRRIIAKYGFISRSTFEIVISRITGANFDQTVTGRIFGFGTVLVHGAGGEISPFDMVAEPQQFQRALMNIIEQVHLR